MKVFDIIVLLCLDARNSMIVEAFQLARTRQRCRMYTPIVSAPPDLAFVGITQSSALASSFYGKFEEDDFKEDGDDDKDDEDDDDEDDYDLDDVDVDSFRNRMSSLFGEGESSESGESSDDSSSSEVDELITFATSSAKSAEEEKDWSRPETTIQKGLVLLANPERFCSEFGGRRQTPSPALLAKFGLTLPPPADLGADRRADLLPVLLIVSTKPTVQAVLLNRRTGYLLGDLEQPEGSNAPLLSKFCIQPLWFGGVDNVSSGLDMLHQCPTVVGADPLTEDGLYWGGDPAQAQDAMDEADKVYTGFDFKFFVQSTVWNSLETLEQELSDDIWFSAIVSKEVLFKSRDRMGSRRAKPLWSDVMELMGGKYKDVRDTLYESNE